MVTIRDKTLPKKKILLTGCTGVLGQALLQQDQSHAWIGIEYKSSIKQSLGDIVIGNITEKRLGLSHFEYKKMVKEIDLIIHAAAITDFAADKDLIFQTNVEGTKRLLELSHQAAVPIFFISTAFVHTQGDQGKEYEPNNYELSKIKAEKEVIDSRLDYYIIRPSMIIGDSLSGQIARFQGLHLLINLFLRGLLPVVPAQLAAYCDFIPQDYLARVLLELIDNCACIENREIWLTSGRRALRVKDIATICTNMSPQLTGRSVPLPKMVSPETFDRLIAPVFLPALPLRNRRVIEQVLPLRRYLNISSPFPSSSIDLESKFESCRLPDLERAFKNTLTYWSQVNGMSKSAIA